MLRELSAGETSGRISGLGSAAGYVGSVLLLLIIYFGFIQGDGDTRGLLGLAAVDGGEVRAAVLLAGAWVGPFGWPLLVSVRTPASVDPPPALRVLGAHRAPWGEGEGGGRRPPHVVF